MYSDHVGHATAFNVRLVQLRSTASPLESAADFRKIDAVFHDFARKRVEVLVTDVLVHAKQLE